jgi:hypothetical protein
MDLIIDRLGDVRCLYDEALDLTALGQVAIERASHVEPTAEGAWTADMRPVGGPVLGPFERRSSALAAERAWLDEHWLGGPQDLSPQPKVIT